MRRDIRLKPLQAWALVDPKNKIRGGNYWCAIYWTRAGAKMALEAYPECAIVRVVVNQIFK